MAGNDSNTLLLVHMDGVDTSTTIPDSSVGGSHGNATVVGTAQLDTAQKEFGTASLLLDGNSDYITFAASDDWKFGTADFTIDHWVRWSSHSTNEWSTFFDIGSAATGVMLQHQNSTNQLYLYAANAYNISSWTPSNDTWYHIAVVRTSGVVRVFIDGTKINTDWSQAADLQTTLAAAIGAYIDGSYQMSPSWIDEFRISDTARWWADFTPPTRAYNTGRRIMMVN